LFFLYGLIIGESFEKKYGKDPSQCTIDEVVGMWISLFLLPKNIIISGIAFFVWRAFDIFKPFPAKRMEKIKGGAGIMLDDVVSALYTLAFMHLLVMGIEYYKITLPF
jgi:Phosphatidylglycerophosphatase A and related proteins